MTKPEITWFEYEITGCTALGRPVEMRKYRTNADASIVQFWSDKKVSGFAKIGWNTTRSINAEKDAAIALKEMAAFDRAEQDWLMQHDAYAYEDVPNPNDKELK
jgi:hypothetical protein